jgi:hypothetical protein
MVVGRPRFGHEDRLINLRAIPFALTRMQTPCHWKYLQSGFETAFSNSEIVGGLSQQRV